VDPIEFFPPETVGILVNLAQSVVLTISPMKPAGHNLKIQWFINRIPVAGANSVLFQQSGQMLGVGIHTISVEVVDTTPMVRNDPERLLAESKSWTVTVTAAPVRSRRRP
jgi:hypothetical protein